MTELPDDFESFFIKLHRKAGQTLQEWSAEFLRAERKLRTTHRVDLPEKIRAWFYLRRSGVSKEQRQMILTNIGADHLDLESVAKAMNFILGQDSKLDGGYNKMQKHQVYYQDEIYDVADEEPVWHEWDQAYYEEEQDSPWVDADEAYYEDEYPEDGPEEIFDVEEFDSVFAAYSDAKNRMNKLRVARGFFPVVAMVNGPMPGGQPPTSPSRTKGGKKGKGKRAGASKGKGSKQGPVSPKGAKARGKAAIGRQLCLRCGQAGHWARDCPSAASDKKRKLESSQDEIMMVQDLGPDHFGEATVYAMDNEDLDDDTQTCKVAVQDGGAASVLGSRLYIKRYLRHLLEHGYDLNEVEIHPCRKSFRYGNSATEETNLCVMLPTVIGGRKRKILTYVIAGSCPILFGRPILARLGMTVDYAEQKMRWPGEEWLPIPKGERGEHLVVLDEDPSLLTSNTDYEEVLAPDDFEENVDVSVNLGYKAILPESELIAVTSIMDNVLDKTNVTAKDGEGENDKTLPNGDLGDVTGHTTSTTTPSPTETADVKETVNVKFSETLPAVDIWTTKDLPKGKLHGMISTTTKAAKVVKKALEGASKVASKHEKVIWEVFAGQGRTTQSLAKRGARTERFSPREGWDFLRPRDRRLFLQRLREEQPDEVLLAPMCKLWSPLQELSLATNPGRRERLCEERQKNHDEILVFCGVIWETQRREGRHAHLEHPWLSRAWKTKAFSRLQGGYDTYVDQCMYGLQVRDDHGVLTPARKPTCFRTTKKAMMEGLGVVCDGTHHHVPLMGSSSDGPRSAQAENYPPELADRLAELMMADECVEDVLAADDGEEGGNPRQGGKEKDDPVKINRELRQKVGAQAFNYVSRLHKNLGHPSPKVLCNMLQEVQATKDVITCAKDYVCPACFNRQRPSGVPPASGITATEFNHRLMLDSAWIDTTDGRACVLTIMCQATRYVALRILKSDTSKDLLKGLERAWTKHYGVPKIIRIDEAKGWSAALVRDWCSDHGVELEIAPAEAHNYLGAVERRHQVVRRALELFMEDQNDRSRQGLLQASIFVPSQVNQLSTVKGFSPAQWVLGKTPASALGLTADMFNPAMPDGEDSASLFAANQKKRTAAQIAFLKADSDLRLRRAMNQNFRDNPAATPQVGQKVFYWRIQGTNILQKNRWRGPARVSPTIPTSPLCYGWRMGQVWYVVRRIKCGQWWRMPDIMFRRIPRRPWQICRHSVPEELHSFATLLTISRSRGFEDCMSDYAPAEPPPAHDSDADNEDLDERIDALLAPVPVPGAVELAFQEMMRRPAGVVRPRSEGEPEPVPEDLDSPAVRSKRLRVLHSSPGLPAASTEAVTSSATMPTSTNTAPTTTSPRRPSSQRPENTALPPSDDELYVDVRMVETTGSPLPDGWLMIDGDLVMDEGWAERVLFAKGEVREKQLTADERAQMVEAKKKELESYFQNAVWQFTDLEQEPGGRMVTARWVLSWKNDEDGGPPRAKARLVLRGFEDPDLGDLEKSSPTATRQSKLLLLAYSASEGWTLYGGDVRTAFLSGANFDRRIIVKLPTDCGPLLGTGRQHTYMKLLKSAYGLADAPLLWYQEADRRLRRIKWRRHPLDKCFYMLYDREYNLIGALILHVDDLLVGGNDKHEEFIAAIKQLREAFNFGKWRQIQEGKTFVYCGGNLDVDGSGIILNYKDYLKKIVPVTVPKDRNERQALNQWEISKARGLLGALQWPAGQGFPALNASVSILASGIPKGDIGLLNELNKTLRFAKSNCESRIHMKKVFSGLDDICVVAFSDASYAVRPDGSSQGGFFIFLTSKKVLEGRSVPYNIVSWKSHKLPRVCRSSLAAEAQAGATALDELVLIRSMLSLMLDPDQDPRAESTAQWPGESVLVIDAKALYDNLKKGGGITSAQDKRTGIEIACIADELKRMKTILRWVSSERMYADGLTKIGARQDLIEMLKTGHFSLVYDKDFVAAKKKTKAERERSQRESGGMYGSRIARTIANVLVMQMVEGADAQGTPRSTNDGMYFQDYVIDNLFTVFLIYTTVLIAYSLFRLTTWLSPSPVIPPQRTVTSVGAQTTELRQDRRLFHLEAMNRDRLDQIDVLEHHVNELQGENRGLRRQLTEAQEALRVSEERRLQGAAQVPPAPPAQPRNARTRPNEVFVTGGGHCFHLDARCHHIRNLNVHRRALCRDCDR